MDPIRDYSILKSVSKIQGITHTLFNRAKYSDGQIDQGVLVAFNREALRFSNVKPGVNTLNRLSVRIVDSPEIKAIDSYQGIIDGFNYRIWTASKGDLSYLLPLDSAPKTGMYTDIYFTKLIDEIRLDGLHDPEEVEAIEKYILPIIRVASSFFEVILATELDVNMEETQKKIYAKWLIDHMTPDGTDFFLSFIDTVMRRVKDLAEIRSIAETWSVYATKAIYYKRSRWDLCPKVIAEHSKPQEV